MQFVTKVTDGSEIRTYKLSIDKCIIHLVVAEFDYPYQNFPVSRSPDTSVGSELVPLASDRPFALHTNQRAIK